MQKTIQRMIGLSICFSLSLLLAACDDDSDSPPPNTSEYHDVIVIGAGISGLEAATVLKGKNIDVAILEARNRVGGRIETTTLDGAYTDLGASWLHDLNNNVLVPLANNVGIPLIPTPYTAAGTAIYVNGVMVDPNDIDALYSYGAPLYHSLLDQQYVNCGPFNAAIDCFIQNNITAMPLAQYANYYYNVTQASWFGDNTNYVSSVVGPGFLNPGTDALPGTGYTNFIDKIFNIKALNIKLNSLVNEINYSKNEVQIKTADNKNYRAKYVIITVPIGVLKKQTIRFIPPLPEDKQIAIKHIGYGLFNKIYLQFDSVFWDQSVTISLPYTADPANNYYMILNYAKFVNKPILLVLDFGDFARTLEKMSDSEIIADIMYQIRLIYPAAPDPVKTIITRWGQDIYSNGSYSYPTVDATLQDYKNLITPVQDTLFFAGEAAIINKNGTADAAYQSGQNAAERIL